MWIYDWSATIGNGYFLAPGTGLVPAKPAVTSGNTVEKYLAAENRWVDFYPLISPDGKQYAYNDPSQPDPTQTQVYRVHVVDLASGADRVIAEGSSSTGFQAVGFESDGVYVGRPSTGPGSVPGLWRLDPQTGALTVIETAFRWGRITQDYAYTVLPNPSDPVAGQGGPVPDTILRLDLQSHTVETWFRQRGQPLVVFGIDSKGRPLVLLGDTVADLVVISGQGTYEPITGGSHDVTVTYTYPSFVPASDGFWFGADQGIYRYSSQTGFTQLWKNPTVMQLLPEVAGPCS